MLAVDVVLINVVTRIFLVLVVCDPYRTNVHRMRSVLRHWEGGARATTSTHARGACGGYPGLSAGPAARVGAGR